MSIDYCPIDGKGEHIVISVWSKRNDYGISWTREVKCLICGKIEGDNWFTDLPNEIVVDS